MVKVVRGDLRRVQGQRRGNLPRVGPPSHPGSWLQAVPRRLPNRLVSCTSLG